MSGLVIESVEALKPYEAGKPIEEVARELGVTNAVKLASNENPLGPSPKAIQAMQQELGSVHRYPDSNQHRLRQRLSEIHGVDARELVLGNGSNEVLELLVRTFATPEHHIVFAHPSFVVYRMAAMAHGIPFTPVPLSNWQYDVDALLAAVTERTRLLFIANPNNPTGTYITKPAMSRLLEELPPQVILVLDEAYIEYVDADDFPDGLTLRSLRERLVICRTFSKIFGLAALRVGYAVLPAQLADYVNRVRAPFNVSSLAQVAALAALDDQEHVAHSCSENQRGRNWLGEQLTALGLDAIPSQANFVLVDLGRPASPVYQALLAKGVIVRPLGPLTNCLRITVGTREENERLVASLKEVLG